MRIVHFSDWHGRLRRLPPADLYVCGGDMLANYRRYAPDGTKLPPDPAEEALRQAAHLERLGPGCLRKLMAEPRAPVVCVRGNHDFTALAPLFDGGPVFEISDDPIRVSRWYYREGPLKIGGVRGVRRHRGRWADELTDAEFADRVAGLPSDLEVLVTHAPPEGILDVARSGSLGVPALRSYVARHDPSLPPLKAHLFGHIHESRGVVALGGTVFSNAACGVQVIDL